MKVKASVRPIEGCSGCKMIKRKGVVRRVCSVNVRHKARQG